MATYAWIAIGGALGSMARAWVAIAVARLTGPQFPWGTIGINVLGSLIIGVFAEITSPAGRFSVPAETRAFVMVGFCGGFTTFSSFSLQTLDLLRDGRPGQALGNVAVSVTLCIASVAAGYYGAGALHPTGARAAAVAGRGRQVALAVLDQPERVAHILSGASRAVQLAGGGRIAALAIGPLSTGGFLPSEEVMTTERAVELAAAGRARVETLRRAFETWTSGAHAGWAETEGDPTAAVARQGRRADLVVLRRPERAGDKIAHRALHAALFDTGRPVLVVPATSAGFGRRVAIAWKDDGKAEAAIRATLDWLRQAESVVLLLVAEDGETGAAVPALLRENGVAAEARIVDPGGRAAGLALIEAAGRMGADLLVMGAYAHGSWREAILGGVTQHVLTESTIPVLLRN